VALRASNHYNWNIMTVHLSNPAHQQQWREQAPTRPEEHQVSTDETAAPSLEVQGRENTFFEVLVRAQ
jgi:hypothetical protein